MLYRKIAKVIEEHLQSKKNSILLVDGARQVGKTFIIREVGKRLFKNFIEINMIEDNEGAGLFRNVTKTDDFLLRLSMVAGERLGDHDDTLV
ncbi:MAG: AAA family ATPase, partial [Candidatus Ornithospirochaeta sp.]